MGINIVKSDFFSGNNAYEVGRQVANWMHQTIPNLNMIYSNTDSSGNFTRALFTYKNEPLGIDLVCVSNTSGSENNLAQIKLKPSYKIYTATSSSGTITPYATAVNNYSGSNGTTEGSSACPCGRFTNESTRTTQFNICAWYAQTENDGLLVGLCRDEEREDYMRYPVYFGRVRNAFLNEEYYYAVQLNRGMWPVGDASSGKAKATEHSTGVPGDATGYAVIIGEGNVIAEPKSRTYRKLYLQHLQSSVESSGSNYSTTHFTICYTPLFAVLADTWCQAFQVDDFYSGCFAVQTHPPILEKIAVNGQVFLPITDDGVALRLKGESIDGINCDLRSSDIA